MIAVILASGRARAALHGVCRCSSRTAAEGGPARGLVTFEALAPARRGDRDARCGRGDARLSAAGRPVFARTLAALLDDRARAAELPAVGVRGGGGDHRRRPRRRSTRSFDGVLSMPRFLAEVGGRAAGGAVRRRSLAARAARRGAGRLRVAAARPLRRHPHGRRPQRERPDARLRRRNGHVQRRGAPAAGERAPRRAPARARPRAGGRAGARAPPGRGTILSYRVRLEQGTVAFGDRSRDIPAPFSRVVGVHQGRHGGRLRDHPTLIRARRAAA